MKQKDNGGYKVRGVNMTREVWAMARVVAANYDMSRAGLFARLIKKEHAKLKNRGEV